MVPPSPPGHTPRNTAEAREGDDGPLATEVLFLYISAAIANEICNPSLNVNFPPETKLNSPEHPRYSSPAAPTATSTDNTKATRTIAETYKPRQLSFRPLEASRICDEKVIRHDYSVARHYESQSAVTTHARNAIQHRELGSLSLIANLTRIRYGYWHALPACLIGFKFQFLGSEARWTRFGKADISIRLSSTIAPTVEMGQESSSSLIGVGADPELVDFGPKHLSSAGTSEKRGWHISAQLAASLPVAPIVPTTPALSAGFSRSYDRHYASSVDAAAFASHGHTAPDTLRFWIREDTKQKDGLPLEFGCAAIVTYAAPSSFQATVEVKTGLMFDMFAQP
ncbi:hypothetical protein Slin14017_G043510 [Septoria linicola]|nr:hypothetical protein Slin14017_G043510 [Septoria linicola]